MSAGAALVLVAGLLLWQLLGHYLQVRRDAFDAALLQGMTDPTTPPPIESEERMTMSKQQLNTLGLSHVRREVAKGKYKAADVKRWKEELGDVAVQQIIDEAAASDAPAAAPARKQSATTEE